MSLPVQPPLVPMLAKLQGELPEGDGWLYEPKWDGFRALVFRDGNDLEVISRDGRPLVRYFPELPPLLSGALPDRCVMDGEVLMAGEDGLDFDTLQLRIHPAASRINKLAAEIPSSFVGFDLLALGDEDLRLQPFSARRVALEGVLTECLELDPMPPLEPLHVYLTPQTDRLEEAVRWFETFESIGLEGIVAKRADDAYLPGKRAMVKVKHKRTVDCVVGGYKLGKTGDGIGALLLGLYDEAGVLHYVGHTSSFKTKERRELLAQLKPLEGDGAFGEGRSPGGQSRWSGAREQAWVSVRPELVCEVSFDRMQGDRFRHAATFMRWRTDKAPMECTIDQVWASSQR
ncbi:MAG: ATP-dependent DNA ligase [Actinobacteria bacterium]|nr:ATP-dependent DNA ligase [Actinomycetota bacterium]